jgi:hypothetical protein
MKTILLRRILYVEMVWTLWPHANRALSPCIILRPLKPLRLIQCLSDNRNIHSH